MSYEINQKLNEVQSPLTMLKNFICPIVWDKEDDSIITNHA